MLQKYIDFQERGHHAAAPSYDLKKAEERAHILEGLQAGRATLWTRSSATIRHCKGGQAEAKAAIMEQFGFDDVQADAIVQVPAWAVWPVWRSRRSRTSWTSCTPASKTTRRSWPTTSRVKAIVKDELIALRDEVRRRAPHRHRGRLRRGGHRGPDPRGAVRLYARPMRATSSAQPPTPTAPRTAAAAASRA